MDWKPVVDIVVTTVFLLGIGLALWGLLTVHRSPYFSEVQKLKWLLLVLFLPYLGPPGLDFAGSYRARGGRTAGAGGGEAGRGSARGIRRGCGSGRVVRV